MDMSEERRSDGSCQNETDHVETKADKQNIHALSTTMSVEVPATEKPTSDIMPKSSPSSLGCSHPTYRGDVVMNTDGEATALKESKVAFLPLSTRKEQKKRDAAHSDEVADLQQLIFTCPSNDEAHTVKQDDGSSVSSPHQDQQTTENTEEKMTYTSILHNMQQQQKRKAGRRFKKKTLMKMAKLLLIAQGWDSEAADTSKAECSNDSFAECEPSGAGQKEDMLKPVTSQGDITNETNSVSDCDRETVLPNNSADMTSSSQTTAPNTLGEMSKTSKGKRDSSTRRKQAKEESKERDYTVPANLPDVSAQETALLSRPEEASEVQKKSKEMSSVTFKEGSEIKSDSRDLTKNNPAAESSFDVCKTQTSKRKKKTSSDPKDRGNTIKQNFCHQILADCTDATPPQSVAEGSLGSAVALKDDNKEVACTTVTDAEIPNKDTSGVKSIAEVLKLKRKAGRPFKKKTLRKIAKLLAVVQEGKLNNETKADVLSSQPPSTSQVSSEVKKRERETKTTASASSTIPVRRSTRTQFCSLKLNDTTEYMESPARTSTETLLLHSQRHTESIVKSEDPAGSPLLDSPSDEASIKTESRDSAIENVMEKTRHPKKNAEVRRNTKAYPGLCPSPPNSITDAKSLPRSADHDLTKTIIKGRKKRMTASKSKLGQSTVYPLSATGISLRKQNKTGHDKVATNISASDIETSNPVLQNPQKRATRSKKCKEEPISLPLSCQTELSLSFCDYGGTNQSGLSESFLQTSHIKTESAFEPVTPQLPNNSNAKRSRQKKKPPHKTKDVVPIKEESGGPDMEDLNQAKQVEKETFRNKYSEKPPKGKGLRKCKKAKMVKENASNEQTISPDLDKKGEVPGQTDLPPREVKKEPDESHVTPIKTTKMQPCRKRKLPTKDNKNAKKPATLTAVCGSGEECKYFGLLGNQLVDEQINDKAKEDGETAVSSESGEMLNAAHKSLKRIGTRKRLKEEPRKAFTENPQGNETDEAKKCKMTKQKTVTFAELVCSDGKVQEVSTQPEDSVSASSLSKRRRKRKCKAVKKESVVDRAMEKNNNAIDKVLNCQDNLTAPLHENPQIEQLMGNKQKKCGLVTENQPGRINDEVAKAANPEDMKILKGKNKCLAVRRNPKVAASAEHNIRMTGVENSLTPLLPENSQENMKDKRKKQCKTAQRRLVDSVKGFSGVVDDVPDLSITSLNGNLAEDVKVKGKKKFKGVKQGQSMVKSVENNIIQTDTASKPEDTTTGSLRSRSKESLEIKIRSRERNKSLGEQLARDGTKKKGKVPATKVTAPKKTVTTLTERLGGNQCVRSKNKKETSAAISSEDTFERENKAPDCKNDQVDSELPKALTSKEIIKSKVATKCKGKSKCQAVKEELTVSTVVVQEEMLNNQPNAVKSKRKGGQTSKEKALLISSEKQEPESDTFLLAKQKMGNKSKIIGKRRKIKTWKTLTSTRSHKRAKVVKTELVDSCSEPVLVDSSSFQTKPTSKKDLNVKLEQDTSEISELTEEAVSPSHDEIRPVESTPSVVPTGKPQTKTVRKRRRNKTGWENTKKKPKRPRTSLVAITLSSSEISGLSSNSSISNSTVDLKLKVENKKDDLTEHQTVEALGTEINNTQISKVLDKDQAMEMTASMKLKHSVTLQKKVKSRKPLECSFCGRSFRHISALTVHKRLHTGEKPYRCLKCRKSFAQLTKLQLHSNIHQQPEALPCPCCAGKFKSKDGLIAHLKTHIKDIEMLSLRDDSVEGKDTSDQQKGDCMDSADTSRDSKSLRCSTCLREFSNRATFKMHQQSHGGVKTHTCPVGGKMFCKSSSLNVHEKTHWPVKPYACSLCGKGFVNLRKLKDHSQTHSGPRPFFYTKCEQTFSSLASIHSHQASKMCCEKDDQGDINGFLVTRSLEGQINTPMYYKCPICKQLHRHWCQYTLHLQTHTNSHPHLCDICGQQYDKVPELNTHCKVCCKSSGEERACSSSLSEIWQEPKQTKSPAREPQLDSPSNDDQQKSPDSDQKEHEAVSSPLETVEKEITDMGSPPPPLPNSPSLDGQSVNNDWEFNVPSPNAGPECPSPASCSVISSCTDQMDQQPPRFRSPSLIRSHCGRYSCGQCGKSFNCWNKLWLHQYLHRKKGRPFLCTQCDLEFRFLGSYVDHLQKHAAQRPYACPLCPDTFATQENFNTHISECQKPHDCIKCSTCGKTFSSLTNLKKHSLLHKGVSSHFCLPCNVSFPSSNALKTHVKTHRARLKVPQPKGRTKPLLFPYYCKKCTAKFTSTDLLEAHQVCHFNEEKEPTGPPANVTPHVHTRAMPGLISGLCRQKRTLPVSNKKYLFRYPHPDRLYVVPIISSEPPVVISDTEEERQEIDSRSPSIPTSTNSTVLSHSTEEQPGASNTSSGQNISNIPQSSVSSTLTDTDEPEPPECRSVTETGSTHHPVEDNLLPCSSDKPPGQSESHESHDVISDCDKDSAGASTVLTTPKEKEPLNTVYDCAICIEKFIDVSKLHEHYLDHARQVQKWPL